MLELHTLRFSFVSRGMTYDRMTTWLSMTTLRRYDFTIGMLVECVIGVSLYFLLFSHGRQMVQAALPILCTRLSIRLVGLA